MQSNGGVLSAIEVAKQPITTLLSGPAAGAIGASYLAGLAGMKEFSRSMPAGPRPTSAWSTAASLISLPRVASVGFR